MVYSKPRKTNRGNILKEKYIEACKRAIQGEGIRKLAREYGMSHVTLSKRLRRFKRTGDVGDGYSKRGKIFTMDQEKQLVSFYEACELYGLSIKHLRIIAFEFAKKVLKDVPSSWTLLGMTGPDWFKAFLSRYPSLSTKLKSGNPKEENRDLRKPDVEEIFNNCTDLLDLWEFKTSVDEKSSDEEDSELFEPMAGCSHDKILGNNKSSDMDGVCCKSEEKDICILCFEPYDKETDDGFRCTDCYKWAHKRCALRERRDPIEFQKVGIFFL